MRVVTRWRGPWAMVVLAALALGVVAWLAVPWADASWSAASSVPPERYFSPAQIAAGERHAAAVRLPARAALVVWLVVLVTLALSRRVRRGLTRLPGPWPLRVGTAVVLALGMARLATLPLGWRIHRVNVRDGLSTQSTPAWLRDVAVSFAVTAVLMTALALLVIGFARRTRRWYLPVGMIVMVATAVLSLAWPLVVEPLFNRFTALPEGRLRAEVMALADRQEVDVATVLVADASRRTTTANAYVSGLGPSRRVVLYDTLLRDHPRREVLAVVAHEVAHARHRDVVLGTTFGALGGGVGVGLLAAVGHSGAVRRRLAHGFADPAAAVVVVALAAVGGAVAAPFGNVVSRSVEVRADEDALAATRDPAAFIALQRRLAVRSLADLTPPAWSQLWFGSHPTTLQRIEMAERVKEKRGE